MNFQKFYSLTFMLNTFNSSSCRKEKRNSKEILYFWDTFMYDQKPKKSINFEGQNNFGFLGHMSKTKLPFEILSPSRKSIKNNFSYNIFWQLNILIPFKIFEIRKVPTIYWDFKWLKNISCRQILLGMLFWKINFESLYKDY